MVLPGLVSADSVSMLLLGPQQPQPAHNQPLTSLEASARSASFQHKSTRAGPGVHVSLSDVRRVNSHGRFLAGTRAGGSMAVGDAGT